MSLRLCTNVQYSTLYVPLDRILDPQRPTADPPSPWGTRSPWASPRRRIGSRRGTRGGGQRTPAGWTGQGEPEKKHITSIIKQSMTDDVQHCNTRLFDVIYQCKLTLIELRLRVSSSASMEDQRRLRKYLEKFCGVSTMPHTSPFSTADKADSLIKE